MTIEEIIKHGRFIENTRNPEYSSLELDFYIEFFEEPVSIIVENSLDTETGPKAELLKELLNELLNLNPKYKLWMEENIWKHYDTCIGNGSYGMVTYEGFDDHKKANQAYFKIYNQEDSYAALELRKIHIDMDSSNRNFRLEYICPWDDEHGLSIWANNGQMEMGY